MNLATHIDALRNKHAALEDMIEAEVSRPLPDDIALHDLKRKKLRLKDELAHLADS